MNDSAESRPLTFGELGVPGPLVRVLAADDKKTAFPIQADTLPDSLAGRDILGRGRTGSGKTLAFSIPLVTRLGSYDSFGEIAMEEFRKEIKRRKKASLEERRADDFLPHPRGLVLAPTRELANQINDVLMPLAHTFGMNTTTVYGGVKYIHQIRDLKAGADIVVACPGRLEDLLRQQALTLSSVEVVVIDEADEMADMGFLPPVKRLLEQISPDAQHMLFSATLDHGVDEVVNTFLHDPKVHEVDSATAEPDLMTHHVFETTRGDKHELVRMLASGEGRRILFTRTKFQAKKLAKNLTQNGIPAADQHGKNRRNDRYGKGDKFDKRDRAGYGRNDDFGSRRHNAGRDFERSDSRDFERPRKPRRNERSHEDYGFSYDERSHDGRRQSMRNTRQGEGGKRIHRKNENRIVRDERSEGAKRHERRMIAKYGNTEGPNRRHSKKNRHNAPFRMKSGRR